MEEKKQWQPKVSVILSVYNTAPFLHQCLDSLVHQTLREIEIICVDDASTDASLTILQQYAMEDDRIIVLEQEHGGAGKARNTGLDKAKGTYLSILDSDDFFELDMLEKMVRQAEEQKAQIVIGRADFYDHALQQFKPCTFSIYPERLPEQQPFAGTDIADRIFNIGCGWAWDKLFERQFIQENGIRFQELRSTNDMFFVFYAYTKAQRISFIDTITVHQRIKAYSSLSVTREQSWDHFYLALMALKTVLEIQGTYDRFRHSFINWALNFSLWHIDTLREDIRRQLIIRCRKEFFWNLDLLSAAPEDFDKEEEYRRMQAIMADAPKIKVSVVMPVYNGETRLRQCLDSLLAQTLQEIQIIIVNDGSTDGTAAVLEEYARKDSRIYVMNKEHTNAGDSRNLGMKIAEGECLSFLDADDFFEPTLLAASYAAIRRDNAEICLFRRDQFVESDGSFRPCPWTLKWAEMPEHLPFSAKECSDHLFTMTSCTAWDKLFRRDFVESHSLKFQSVGSCNDMCFTFSALALAGRMTVVDHILVHQRVAYPKSLCQDMSLLWGNFEKALIELKDFLTEQGLYDRFRISFLNWAIDFSLWNLHYGHPAYREHIRYQLTRHTFEALGLSNAGADVFFHQDLYQEMQTLLLEAPLMTDPTIPKVSVILSIYNAEAYIEECLDSILDQTLQNIEIICVDDGSTDETPAKLAAYAAQDQRITVVTKEHTNAGEGRNAGLALAKGEYLSFLDADDFFEPTLLARAYYRAKEQQADICLLPSDQYVHNERQFRETPWTLRRHLLPVYRPFAAAEAADHLFQLSGCTAWNKLFSRRFVEENGLQFQSNLICNDMLFTYSALASAGRITEVEDKPLIHQRVGHPKKLGAAFEYCTSCYANALSALQDFLVERHYDKIFRKSFLNWALDFSLFSMHSYTGVYKRLVRQQLKRRYLDRWHLSEASAEDFYRPDQYAEMREILSERVVRPPRTKPVVSVVMPLYNVAQYLPAALDCLLFQTYENIEILCVDDGSTDNTLDILRQYRKEDKRVHIIRQDNRGAGAARNKGMYYVRGTYVLFLDGDDIFHADLIEKALAKATETDADIVAFNFTQSDAEGNYVHRVGIHTEWLDRDKNIFNYLDCPERIMTIVNPTPWNKLFRAAFIRENDLYYEEITSSNDITFSAVSVAAARRIAYLKDELLHYNRGLPGSITVGKHKKLYNVVTAVTSAVIQVRELPYAEEIEEAVLYFAIDNFLFALKNNVLDYHDALAHQYYDYVHSYFKESMFDGVTEEMLGGNTTLYHRFLIVRELSYEQFIEALDKERILSVTSYPARMTAVAASLVSLTEQTLPADRIILWLAEEQFPQKEQELPQDLLALLRDGKVTLRWCQEDLAPHKKYFYAMQEYPDAVIITADDDIVYPKTMVEELFRGYLLYPRCVSAAVTHLMTFSDEGKLLPYSEWVREYDEQLMVPSRQYVAVGVGGVLYPPHLLHEALFRSDIIRHACLFADDLWLKVIECLSGVPVVCVSSHRGLNYVPDSQEVALWRTNLTQQKNDMQLKRCLRALAKEFGSGFMEKYILADPQFKPYETLMVIQNRRLERRNQELQQHLRQAQQQISDLQRDYRSLKQQYGDFRIYSSVTALGLPKGESIFRIYESMPSNSMLLADAAELSPQDRPSRFGVLQIIKLSKARSTIQFHAKEENGNAHMFLRDNDLPTGEWLLDHVFVSRRLTGKA